MARLPGRIELPPTIWEDRKREQEGAWRSVLDILSVRCQGTPLQVATLRDLQAVDISLGNISIEGI